MPVLLAKLALADSPSSPAFTVPDDLRVELVLAEPQVRQPVYISFDERGRLWVVQYLQYPYPAGLKMLSRDSYLRARLRQGAAAAAATISAGEDKITIHEDTDGDGTSTSTRRSSTA